MLKIPRNPENQIFREKFKYIPLVSKYKIKKQSTCILPGYRKNTYTHIEQIQELIPTLCGNNSLISGYCLEA